jgi:TRAP transporter TAXI family solute receptor
VAPRFFVSSPFWHRERFSLCSALSPIVTRAIAQGIDVLKKLLFGLVVIAVAGYALFTVTEEPAPQQINDRFVVLGTGGATGVYYPVGQAICDLLNAGRADHGIRCSARTTAGSFYNIEALRRGEVEYAIVQSDWQYYAVSGAGAPQPMLAFPALRSIMSLHGEVLSIVVRQDAKIRTLSDLAGKRVNLGLPGSGQRESIRLLFESMGQQIERLVIATEFSPEEQSRALCEGSSDALVYLAGHPNAAIGEALKACDAAILPIDDELAERFVRQNPYYGPATIPAGSYPNQSGSIRSVGLLATLVTTTRESEEGAYQMTRAIYEGFDKLKSAHPALADLDKMATTKIGLTAPLHRGAERYLRAAGLIPPSAQR